MSSKQSPKRLIEILINEKGVSSELLEKFKLLEAEPLWHQILILLEETDQFQNLLNSSNEKEVHILAGEIQNKVLLNSKKDYIVNPGRRLLKEIESQKISSIIEANNNQSKNVAWEGLYARTKKLQEKEQKLDSIRNQLNQFEEANATMSGNGGDEYRKHIEYLEKRLIKIKRESSSRQSNQPPNKSSLSNTSQSKKNQDSIIAANNATKVDEKFPRLHPLAYTAILLLLSPFLISSIGSAIRFWMPSENTSEPEIQCPGQTTVEMQWCASQLREESEQSLKGQLNPELLDNWKSATQEVCAAVHAPYRRGSIYTQLFFGCNDRLNRVLLEEFKRMGG